MTIKLNDKTYEINEGASLAYFVESLAIKIEGIAVAISYEVVPKDKWKDTVLKDGMEIILIQAVSGG